MKFGEFFETKWFKWTLVGIGALIVVLLAFDAGVSVGYHKARFSYAWADNYDRNFGGPPRGIPGFPIEPGFMPNHGTVGKILSVGSSTIIVSGREGMEKTVVISSSTEIRAAMNSLAPSDLKPNDEVVVIGSPNDNGQIEARFIRVLR